MVLFSACIFHRWERRYPGVMELSMLLQQRSGMRRFGPSDRAPADPQYAVFIAAHYRSLITNEAAWSSPIALVLIKGDARRFAEQSVADHVAPTEKQIAEAEAALKPYVSQAAFPDVSRQPGLLFMITCVCLVVYVGFPALLSALLFRGGLVLLIANVAFVRRDGMRASRLRVFWRALVAWSPVVLALILYMACMQRHAVSGQVLAGLAVCGLAVLSVVLPGRGLPDRLAGTWPVPR
jgi:hypothetical protein